MAERRVALLNSVWLAGFLGAAAVTAFMYVAGSFIGMSLGGAVRFLGGTLGVSGPSAPIAGGIILGLMAFVWAFLFRNIRDRIPAGRSAQGILFGLAVWALSTIVIWPLLAALRSLPVEPGVFGLGLGGLPAALTSLTAHGLYGAVLAHTLPAGES